MPLSPDAIELMIQQVKDQCANIEKKFDWRIDKIEDTMDKGFSELKQMIIENREHYVLKTEYDYTKQKVLEIEWNWKKIIRIVLTAVLTAVLAIVIKV